MTGFIRNKLQNVVTIIQYVCEKFVEFLFVGKAGETQTWQRRTKNKIMPCKAVQFYTKSVVVN